MIDTAKPPTAPPWYMAGEKRTYLAAWRDGFYGNPMRRSKWPNAYGRGYNEGLATREARKDKDL